MLPKSSSIFQDFNIPLCHNENWGLPRSRSWLASERYHRGIWWLATKLLRPITVIAGSIYCRHNKKFLSLSFFVICCEKFAVGSNEEGMSWFIRIVVIVHWSLTSVEWSLTIICGSHEKGWESSEYHVDKLILLISIEKLQLADDSLCTIWYIERRTNSTN